MVEKGFLPINAEECKERGWGSVDFVYVNGDAYVDHPSFGAAIITRVLEDAGFKVAFLAQPDYKSCDAFKEFGRPRLGFLVSAGNIDSMVAHYTASKKKRSYDYYSPGGKMGLRPDRAVIVYCNRIREAYGDVPIIIGGIEASLRRFAHYDYWDNKIRRSVLVDSRADILTYGMGESIILKIAKLLDRGVPVKKIRGERGCCYTCKPEDEVCFPVACELDFNKIKESRQEYARAFGIQYKNQDAINGKAIVEYYDNKKLVQNPPAFPLERQELDKVYALPYMRNYHPVYEKDGGVPAISEVKFSITHNRGCFGGCNFCALAFHQGRSVRSRSIESVVREAEIIASMSDFKGYIHDVGGPTANFRYPACKKQLEKGVCSERKCLVPTPCPNLEVDHSEYIELLNRIQAIPKIKKVFIRSGIRFDYMMYDKSDAFFKKLVKEHISGQLKVAPEHCSSNVLKHMGKPDISVYDKFREKYFKLCKECGKEQYLVPYLMSSHPGSEMKDAVELALYLKDLGLNPEQVQDFYPTPGTASTVMYYTGINPLNMKRVYAPDDYREKLMQRALLQYKRPENRNLVREALIKAGREDLIGFEGRCLVRPDMRVGSEYYNNCIKNEGSSKDKPTPKSAGKKDKNSKNGAKNNKKLTQKSNNKNVKNAHRVAKNDKKSVAKRKK
ncbi:MAG: YgiQ family radical SAM protein [Clostridia bacterium]|nr:YgiQ family radical SAM protein [Clostridia bacterium]